MTMSVVSLTQIEKDINMLPLEEQLLLLERIIHRLRKKEKTAETDIDKQMAVMASDNEVMMELEKINEEFALTEMDGLGMF
jgi:hypothetical protein